MNRPRPWILIVVSLALGAAAGAGLVQRQHGALIDSLMSVNADAQSRHMSEVAASIHEALTNLEQLHSGEYDELAEDLELRVKAGIVQMKFSDVADASMLERAIQRAEAVLQRDS